MSDKFDAKKEAGMVEWMGYGLMHGSMADYSPFAEELGRLNKEQVAALGNQLKWDNWKPNVMPSVEMQVDRDGLLTGLSFKPSIFDTKADSAFAAIGIPHEDANKK